MRRTAERREIVDQAASPASRIWWRRMDGDVPASVLLGLGVGTENDIENRKSHHEMEHEGHEGGTTMRIIRP